MRANQASLDLRALTKHISLRTCARDGHLQSKWIPIALQIATAIFLSKIKITYVLHRQLHRQTPATTTAIFLSKIKITYVLHCKMQCKLPWNRTGKSRVKTPVCFGHIFIEDKNHVWDLHTICLCFLCFQCNSYANRTVKSHRKWRVKTPVCFGKSYWKIKGQNPCLFSRYFKMKQLLVKQDKMKQIRWSKIN